MPTAQKSKGTVKSKTVERGLLAIGSCGAWQVDIDEALSGEQHWMQIEGPALSLYFEISTIDLVGKMVRYLALPAKSRRLANGSAKKAGPLVLGGRGTIPVNLVRDDEFADRFYFVIGPMETPTARLVIAGVSELAKALRQTEEDLENDD